MEHRLPSSLILSKIIEQVQNPCFSLHLLRGATEITIVQIVLHRNFLNFLVKEPRNYSLLKERVMTVKATVTITMMEGLQQCPLDVQAMLNNSLINIGIGICPMHTE